MTKLIDVLFDRIHLAILRIFGLEDYPDELDEG
jgi:hypothetical protein